MQKLSVEYRRVDERGSLIQVNTGKWRQLNHLIIKKHSPFGGHYHKHKKELFYVLQGKVMVTVRKNGTSNTEYIKAGECLLIEPYDWHTLYALKDSVLVELLSAPYSKEDTIDD